MSDAPSPTPTIHEALTAVMADVRAVGKDDRNDQQGFMFRGIDAVMNAVGPILRRHSVIVTPFLASVDYATATTRNGVPQNVARVVVRYVFTGPGGDTMEAVVPGEAFDGGDKATAKAMSVAYRTALLQALTLPTHDRDPDADTYDATPQNVNRATGEVRGDPAAELYDAIAATDDLNELRAIYKRFSVGSAPTEVRERFAARVAEVEEAAKAPA